MIPEDGGIIIERNGKIIVLNEYQKKLLDQVSYELFPPFLVNKWNDDPVTLHIGCDVSDANKNWEYSYGQYEEEWVQHMTTTAQVFLWKTELFLNYRIDRDGITIY